MVPTRNGTMPERGKTDEEDISKNDQVTIYDKFFTRSKMFFKKI